MRHLIPFALCAGAFGANLDSYPAVSAVKVGDCLGKLSPGSSSKVESPMPCRARILFKGREAVLPKDTQWAEIDAERLSVEERRLANAKATLARREKNDAEAGLRRAEIERRVQEVSQQLVVLENQDDSALGDIEGGEKFRAQLAKRAKDTKEALTRQSDLLLASLDSFEGNRAGEIESARVSVATQELEIIRLRELSKQRMPFAGSVTLLVEPDADGFVRLQAGQAVANIEDRSRYLVAVPTGTQSWRFLPPGSLTALVRLPGGERLRATFYSSESAKVFGREEQVYLFQVEKESMPAAARFGAGNIMTEIVHTTAEPVRVIPKLRFAAEHPDAFKGGADWATAVGKVWPGASIKVEGQSVLGVTPPAK